MTEFVSGNWSYNHRALLIAIAANFSQVGTRVVIGPLVPFLIAEFDTSTSTLGMVMSGMWALFAVAHYPSGSLAERYGEKLIIVSALVLGTAGSILLVWTPVFQGFVLAAALLGVSTGFYFVVGTSFLSRLYGKNSGQVFGVHSSGGAIAGSTLPAISVYLGSRFSWRVGLLPSTVAIFLMALLFVIYIRPTPPVRPNKGPVIRWNVSAYLVQDSAMIGLILIAIVCVFTWQSILSFLPMFLIEYRGMSNEVASILYSILFLLSAISMPFIGRIADRYGTLSAIQLCLGVLVCGFLLLLGWGSMLAPFAAILLLGVGTSWGGAVQSLFMARLPANERSSGFGKIRALYMIVGALGSAVTGVLADVFNWSIAYGAVSAVALTACVVVGYQRRYGSRPTVR